MFGRREPEGEEIARRAHGLYLQRGGKHGKDVEDWVRAEKELSEELVVRCLIDELRMSKHLAWQVARA